MADPFENRHIDKRVLHRYLRKGIVDEKDLEKHVKNLPDLAEQAAPVEASIEGQTHDAEDDAEGGA
jgi:hypothetical protein